MADRISDERLAQMKPHAIAAPTSEIGKLVAEAVQSRARIAQHEELLAKLRALAERMWEFDAHEDLYAEITSHQRGENEATERWHAQLSSLLASQ